MRIRVLFLYAEVMGYTMATLRALVDSGAEVHVVHWDHKKLTPYALPSAIAGLTMYPRSTMSTDAILALTWRVTPDITVVSGWMDKAYLAAAKALRRRGGIVACSFDAQWHSSIRQRFASLLGKFGYFRTMFSHAWVCGVYQYEYARRIGFNRRDIVFDLYSADIELFGSEYAKSIIAKGQKYPHRFLYVGRLEPVKGLDTLLKAWVALGNERGDWELHLIGSGSLGPRLSALSGIVVREFMQPAQLVGEIVGAGCFLLPSRSEPWGVVLHEFAAAGLPLIASDQVGARIAFLLAGLNGFTFVANNTESLAASMRKIIRSTDDELLSMGRASHGLSTRVTPATSAANLLSLSKTNSCISRQC